MRYRTVQKRKINGVLLLVMSVVLISCASSGNEEKMPTSVTEETIPEETIPEESVPDLPETEEVFSVQPEKEEIPVVQPETEDALATPTEIHDTYPDRVGLEYVEKPQKRSRAEAIDKIEELSLQYPQLLYVVENEAVYPEGLLTSLANNPEMADYMCGYPDSDGSVTGGLTDTELAQEYPLLLQFDPRWGYYPYGSTVMAHSGCGPTCLSMAIVYLTGDETITPDAVGKYSMDNGYYVTGVGTAWALLEDYPAVCGLRSTKLSVSEEAMNQELEKGNILICSMRPGNFTSGGHFVVVYGADEDGYKVNDPKCVYRSNQSWSYEELSTDIKGIWCIGR